MRTCAVGEPSPLHRRAEGTVAEVVRVGRCTTGAGEKERVRISRVLYVFREMVAQPLAQIRRQGDATMQARLGLAADGAFDLHDARLEVDVADSERLRFSRS